MGVGKESINLHKKRVQSIRDKMNRQNLNKIVKERAMGHWSLKSSIAVVVAALFFWAITKSIIMPVILIAAVIWGISHFYYNLNFKSEKFIDEYVSELQQMLVIESKRKRRLISDQLKGSGSNEGAEQVDKFYEAFDHLKDSLRQHFNENEITYKRYVEAANEVLLSGIDNLQDVISALTSIKDIDHNYLKERISALENAQDDFEKKEKKILEKRLDMYESEVNRIQKMLLENEQAVDQIKMTTSALGNIKHDDKEESNQINESIRQLQEMTNKLNDNAS